MKLFICMFRKYFVSLQRQSYIVNDQIVNTTMNTSSAKERRALILRILDQKDEVILAEISQHTGRS